MSAATAPERPRLGWRIAAVVGAIYALFVAAQDIDWLTNFGGLVEHGDFGMDAAPAPEIGPGMGRVVAVAPGSSAAAVGMVVGDGVRSPERWKLRRVPAVGDQVRVTVYHGGGKRDVTLTATASRAAEQHGDIGPVALSDWADLPAALLGFFILVRSRARPIPVLLGLALASFGLAFGTPGPVFSWMPSYLAVATVDTASATVQYVAFLAFGLMLLNSVDGGRRWRWIAFALYLPLLVLWSTVWAAAFIGVDSLLNWTLLKVGAPAWAPMLTLALTAACLLAAWRRSPAGEKGRLALLAVALGCIIVDQAWIIGLGSWFRGRAVEHFGEWPMLAMDVLAGVIAPALFAYAILKHRVLDLGFALNRTLVYSGVSAILLAAFGLTEWAVDHFVKIEGREQNALIDAAIALAVFLAFHRVRDFVEHAVEALFFRRWQEKEAALRRFVREAAFVTRRAPLLKGFAGALSRFADGADAALYLSGEEGTFARAEGRAGPARIDGDDPALVTMRADGKPVELADSGSAIAAELCAPMIHRGELIGFVLLGAKPDAAGYRPDEIELIGWAAVQVGLDLHALEVEHLQSKVARLENQLEGVRIARQPA